MQDAIQAAAEGGEIARRFGEGELSDDCAVIVAAAYRFAQSRYRRRRAAGGHRV